MKSLLIAAAAGLALMAATPASAAIVLNAGNLDCDLTTGCLFDGNNNDNSTVEIETAYNTAHIEGPPPALLDLGDFLTTINGVDAQNYNWDIGPLEASYVLVKSSTQFMLFKIDPASTGSVSGFITTNDGFKDISHVSFWGGVSAVPEPATWAMMITGFGLAGSALRRRRERGLATA